MFSLVLLSFQVSARAETFVAMDSLSQAIAIAKSGDTILVTGPTVFHEHVVLDKPLHLLGTNSPVIDAGGAGTPITIQAEGASVRGFTVRNGGRDLGAFDAGIMIAAGGVTVADCRVEGGGFGLYIRGVNDCRVEHNTVLGDTNVPPAQRGNGIHLWKTRHNVIAGNSIAGTRDGAYFSYADDNLIVSNRIEGTRFGIHYMYSHQNRLVGNTLDRNAVGAALMFARDCVVEGNRAFANRRHGILLMQVEHSRLARNTVWGQNRGFFVQLAVQNRFEENVIANNDIGLYLSNGSEENVFTGNSFLRNTDQVWQPPNEVAKGWQAANQFSDRGRGNFWSDYTGADADQDGVGDTPYHETDLFGYIVDRHPEARVFALSPALALLRKGEELLPLLETPGVTDPAPLMTPPRLKSETRISKSEGRPKSEVRNATAARTAGQGFGFRISDLFRISNFVLRILDGEPLATFFR